jgi:P4 family phage/plasmid primase-like protien
MFSSPTTRFSVPPTTDADGNILAFSGKSKRQKSAAVKQAAVAPVVPFDPVMLWSKELRFANAQLTDPYLALGGINVDDSIDTTIYRWTDDKNGARWQAQNNALMRSSASAWFRDNLPCKTSRNCSNSALETLTDLMISDRKYLGRPNTDTNLIPLRNAYLIIGDDGSISAHKPDPGFGVDYVVAADLDWSRVDPVTGFYQPSAPAPGGYWHKYLTSTFSDQATEELAREAFSTVLLSHCYEKMILMYGEGENGKSVMIHILKKVMPKHAAIRVPRLASNEFGLTQLIDKRLALVGEMPARMDQDTQEVLKGLISQDPQPCEYKGKDQFTFVPRAVWVGATNHHIAVSDHEHGFWRKLLTIPFTNRVRKEEKIQDIHKLITGDANELAQVIDWLLLGAQSLIQRGSFLDKEDMPESVKALAKVQRIHTDTVAAWLEDVTVQVERNVLTEKHLIYADYVEQTNRGGKKPVSEQGFWARMKEHFREDGLDTAGEQKPSKGNKTKRVRHVALRVEGIEPGYSFLVPTPEAELPPVTEADPYSETF